MLKLINGDAFAEVYALEPFEMAFLDPPDNLGLQYNSHYDNIPNSIYLNNLDTLIHVIAAKCQVIWISFNSKYTFPMGRIFERFLHWEPGWVGKACVQTFTFYQHNKNDLGDAHRNLWRLMKKYAPLYPDAIRVPSWRLLNGDKRANPEGKIPGTNFDVPRVTGNSKQRRNWHPTQLGEDLYERCIKLCCREQDTVVDLFAGTGTLARVADRCGVNATMIEIDKMYCSKIAEEHQMKLICEGVWERE
jgi:DNA modification methylase